MKRKIFISFLILIIIAVICTGCDFKPIFLFENSTNTLAQNILNLTI